MQHFRVPEIFLGCFLTIAVFSMGMIFERGRQPPNPNQSIPKHEASSDSQKSQSPDAELTGSTWLTKDASGFFTFGLVLVGGVQVLMFFIQLKYMRRGMDDATVAARASSRSAKATVAQARIARDSLEKVQRPYAFVFGAFRLETKQKNQFTVPTTILEYKVANYGQTPAVIKSVGAEFIIRQDGAVHAPIGVEAEHPLYTSPVLPPGDVRTVNQMCPDNLVGGDIIVDLSEDEIYGDRIATVSLKPPDELYFRVIVYYDGPFSEGHKTSACWRYEQTTSKFVQHGGREYNYTE
ncbi:hypothetical protein [Bradyrhizobium erythrophlei]|uniref:Uncharacterized protein n=1 Tax=Bradyrhizobium erythrophlei TaxID=1437360 RepID=A0A1M7TEG3_9BRAD|nr:hypothetical protein [Bradyrhizobium erythrophlei]SHN69120.1 hypothetical protein SAMN05444170_1498 [Bradyrhizobium erythrophlei]